MTEIQIQTACFQWAWNNYPQTRRLIFHVPNGGKRSMSEALQFKASGVVAGVPDILFIWQGKIYAFEFKDDKGAVSHAQKELHPIWETHQVPVTIIKGEAGIPLFKAHFQKIINQ